MFIPPPPPDPRQETNAQAEPHAAWSDPHPADASTADRRPPADSGGFSAQIIGIEGMSGREIVAEVERGGRFVIFHYCISLIVVTFFRSSNIYFLRAGESASPHSGRYSVLSAVLGWWGLPWGLIRTMQALTTNANGGLDVTAEVLASLGVSGGSQPEPPQYRSRKRGKRRRGDDYGPGD